MNILSGFLSLLLTGLGQIRNGSIKKGVVFMVVPLVIVGLFQFGLLSSFKGFVAFLIIALFWKIASIVDSILNDVHEQKGVKSWILAIILIAYYAVPFSFAVKAYRSLSSYASFSIPTTSMQSTLMLGDYVMSKKLKSEGIERGDVVVFLYPGDNETFYVKRSVALPGDTLEINQGKVYVNSVLEKELPSYQKEFNVSVGNTLNPKVLNSIGITEFGYNQYQSSYSIFCTTEQAKKVKAIKGVNAVEEANSDIAGPEIYPYNSDLEWTTDFYGPFVIPKKGMTVFLDTLNYALYSGLIETHESDIAKRNSTYTFKNDYFFMMGDNRKRSADSRYFGLVPAQNIAGKMLYVFWSKDKSRIGLSIN